eukprot:COSAG01_NODE_1456_length_10254_cov_12.591630_1_plen_41_part_10
MPQSQGSENWCCWAAGWLPGHVPGCGRQQERIQGERVGRRR